MPLPPLVRQVVDKKLSKYCAAKIPPEYQDQIRVHYKVRGNSVMLFESRPYWDDPAEWSNPPVAQFCYDPEDNT
jgi:hypothetical protein